MNINSLRWESSVGTRTEDFTVFGTQFSYVFSIVTLVALHGKIYTGKLPIINEKKKKKKKKKHPIYVINVQK